jgi:hypothetical protein
MVLGKEAKLAVEEFVNSKVEKYTLPKLRLLMRESKFMRWTDLYEEFKNEDQVSDYFFFIRSLIFHLQTVITVGHTLISYSLITGDQAVRLQHSQMSREDR